MTAQDVIERCGANLESPVVAVSLEVPCVVEYCRNGANEAVRTNVPVDFLKVARFVSSH